MTYATDAAFVATLAELPAEAEALFADPLAGPGVAGFYDSRAWYQLLCDTAVPDTARAGCVLIRLGGELACLLPVMHLAKGAVQSLTSPYTCLHRPLLAPGLTPAAVTAIGAALARYLRRATSLRLDALDAEWPHLTAFCAGLRRGGLRVLPFQHFGNWHVALAAPGWTAYLASRDGALRETIRRRRARIARDKLFRFEMVRDDDALAPAIAAFEAVYAKSWKGAEPFPAFNAQMMRRCAALGVLRLALLWHGAQPVAVQYWIVVDGTAQILKLAQDPQYDAASPGTVLTAWTIAQLLDGEAVGDLDFGRGDDGYKRLWTGARRQRIGIVAANPWRIYGLAIILRHQLGRIRNLLKQLQKP